MTRITLKNKILVVLMLMVFVSTLSAIFVTLTIVSRNMRQEILLRGDRLAHSYIEPVSELVLAGNRDSLSAYVMNEQLRNPGISYILVFDRNNALLAHTFFGDIPANIIAFQHSSPSGSPHRNEVLSLPDGEQVYDIDEPLLHNIGKIRMGFNKSIVDQSVKSINRSLFVLLLPLPVLTLFLAGWMSDFLMLPLARLKEKALQIGHGDFTTRIQDTTQDELGDLARAFNRMGEQLEKITVNRDYFDNIIANIAALLVVIDSQGKILFVNSAVMEDLNIGDADLLGEDIGCLLDDDNETSKWNGMDLVRIINAGALMDYDTNFVRKDGTLLPVILSGGVMEGKNGKPGNMVLIAKNATERRQAEKSLRKANEGLRANQNALKNMMYDMKRTHDELNITQAQLVQSEKLASLGQLSAGVAHEINNPLSFVTNNIEILGEYIVAFQKISRAGQQLRQLVDGKNWEEASAKSITLRELEEELSMAYISEDTSNLIEQTKIGVDRIKRIVQDLKTFARKDEGQMELNNIEEIIDSVMNIVWNEIKYTSELRKEYGGLPPVRCNSQRLGQVFIALLVNASQSITEQQGIITVKTFVQGAYACVSIGDNGCGIPPEELDSIFNPFFTTKPVGIGTGLGLSISHEIISMHDGLIEVDSTVGTGTTFIIKLPLSKSENTRDLDVPV